MKLTVRQPSASQDAKHYTTDRLRSEYLIEKVFEADEAVFTFERFKFKVVVEVVHLVE